MTRQRVRQKESESRRKEKIDKMEELYYKNYIYILNF